MNTFQYLAMLTTLLTNLVFVLDVLSAVWSAIRKKPYKSVISRGIESISKERSIWWLFLLFISMYVYGFRLIW